MGRWLFAALASVAALSACLMPTPQPPPVGKVTLPPKRARDASRPKEGLALDRDRPAGAIVSGRRRPELAMATGRTHRRKWELLSRALRVRREFGPELALTNLHTGNDVESVFRESAAFRMPVRDRLSLAAVLECDSFLLDRKDASDLNANLTSLELRYILDQNRKWRYWAWVMPYTGKDITGTGVGCGVRWRPGEGIDARVKVEGWMPWDANTYSVLNDGRRHGISAAVRRPLTTRLTATVDGASMWYELGGRAPGGAQWAGQSNEVGVRLDYTLFRRTNAVMSDCFYDRRVEQEDALRFGVIPYAAFRHKLYHMTSGFDAVPVSQRSSDFRFGVVYNQPLNRHWGFSLGAYMGQDPLRNLDWGQVNGVHGRLIFVVSHRVRLWLGYGLDADTESGVEGGATQALECGLNINF